MLNFLFRIVSVVRRGYWFIFRPITVGVKVIPINSNSQVLLIKNRYDKYWYLPGGGVKKGEALLDCAKREMREEAGIEIGELKILGVYSNFCEYKSDHIILLHADVADQRLIKGLEIDQLEFFDLRALPTDISPATKRRLEEYRMNAISNGQW
jgi:8-oxo-dGTP pyrophosphatase MutT (NUDIX family)